MVFRMVKKSLLIFVLGVFLWGSAAIGAGYEDLKFHDYGQYDEFFRWYLEVPWNARSRIDANREVFRAVMRNRVLRELTVDNIDKIEETLLERPRLYPIRMSLLEYYAAVNNEEKVKYHALMEIAFSRYVAWYDFFYYILFIVEDDEEFLTDLIREFEATISEVRPHSEEQRKYYYTVGRICAARAWGHGANDETLAAKAEQFLRNAIKLGADPEWYLETVEKLERCSLGELGLARQPSVEAMFHLARLLQHRGEYSEAIRWYEGVLKLAPWLRIETHYFLGQIYVQQEEYEKARAKMEQVIELSKATRGPEQSAHMVNEAYASLGLIALKEGNPERAVKMLEMSLEAKVCVHLRYLGFRTELAEALIKEGLHDPAVRYLETAAEITPEANRIEELLEKAVELRGAKKQ